MTGPRIRLGDLSQHRITMCMGGQLQRLSLRTLFSCLPAMACPKRRPRTFLAFGWIIPPVDQEVEKLIVRMGKENRSWGYDRIVGALADLGYRVSDQTVGNVLCRHGIPPAPDRKRTTTWADFIRIHLAGACGD